MRDPRSTGPEKYSIGEYERRFLLTGIPAGVSDRHRIADRYLEGTRLRLRLVATREGDVVQRKLGHKRRIAANDPTAVWHTSLYLDDAEYALLAALPGRTLTKTRWSIDVDGQPAAVDVFEDDLSGLIMIEVDLGDPDKLGSFDPPVWAGAEVTNDEAFTGGALAGLDGGGLDGILAPYR